MSRKLFILYVVLVLATLGTFGPPLTVWIIELCGKKVAPFSILGSSEWVSMVTLVVSTYFGSNVWEKHVALSNGVMPSQIDDMPTNFAPNNIDNTFVVNDISDDDEKEALKNAFRHGN